MGIFIGHSIKLKGFTINEWYFDIWTELKTYAISNLNVNIVFFRVAEGVVGHIGQLFIDIKKLEQHFFRLFGICLLESFTY